MKKLKDLPNNPQRLVWKNSRAQNGLSRKLVVVFEKPVRLNNELEVKEFFPME